MHLRGLDITRFDGPALPDSVLDEIMRLRGEFMAIRSEVDPANDRAHVSAWLRTHGCSVALGRDREGVLQTVVEMNSRRVQHEGQSRVLYFSNYAFAARGYRDHPAFTLGNLFNFAVLVRRHGVRSLVTWIGAVYPPPFITAARTMPQVWLSGEPNVPRRHATFAERMAPEIFGASWMAEDRLVRMRTLPEPLLPTSADGAALLARYEARNPNWREGYGALLMVPLTVGNIAGVMAQLGRRTLGLRR